MEIKKIEHKKLNNLSFFLLTFKISKFQNMSHPPFDCSKCWSPVTLFAFSAFKGMENVFFYPTDELIILHIHFPVSCNQNFKSVMCLNVFISKRHFRTWLIVLRMLDCGIRVKNAVKINFITAVTNYLHY